MCEGLLWRVMSANLNMKSCPVHKVFEDLICPQITQKAQIFILRLFTCENLRHLRGKFITDWLYRPLIAFSTQ